MRKVKDFDCVEMKNRIQADLRERFKGMTEEEIDGEQRRRLEANPILGPLSKQWKVVNPKTAERD